MEPSFIMRKHRTSLSCVTLQKESQVCLHFIPKANCHKLYLRIFICKHEYNYILLGLCMFVGINNIKIKEKKISKKIKGNYQSKPTLN